MLAMRLVIVGRPLVGGSGLTDAEGIQAGKAWMSSENEAFSTATPAAPPPKRDDPKFQGNFDAYVQAMEKHLEKHARGCLRDWYASSGHYAEQIKRSYRFCYSMGRSLKTGMYDCVGLFSEAEFPETKWKQDLLASDLYQDGPQIVQSK